MTTLAQFDFDRWESIIAVLVLVLLPLLGSLGKVLRKRSGQEPGAGDEDEVLGEEIILLPPKAARPSAPAARPLHPPTAGPPVRPRLERPPLWPPPRPRPARPARPAPPPLPARPVRPPVRPAVSGELAPTPSQARPELRPGEMSRDSLAREFVRPTRLVDAVRAGESARRAAHQAPLERVVVLGRLDRDELRKAVILSEVLRPPLALRTPGSELWDA